MGYGSLLDLECRTLMCSLCLWLLERFNTIRHSLELYGGLILLYPHDVELMMGLPARGKDVVNSGSDDLVAELHKKYTSNIYMNVVNGHLLKIGIGEQAIVERATAEFTQEPRVTL
ncbi:hypothetical protein Tco_0040531 [Tanacetum coccineum]